MAKKKKKSAKHWKKKAIQLWSSDIREIGLCEICGREGKRGKTQGWTNLDAHHLIPKVHSEYATDLSNGVCLCVHCHQWHSSISPHQNRDGFLNWLEANRPGQYKWYDRHCPVVDGKRRVKKTPGLVVKWKLQYEILAAAIGK